MSGAFPEALRMLRGERSQAECAKAMGRTQTWWSYLETGAREPNLASLEAFSREGLRLACGFWDVVTHSGAQT